MTREARWTASRGPWCPTWAGFRRNRASATIRRQVQDDLPRGGGFRYRKGAVDLPARREFVPRFTRRRKITLGIITVVVLAPIASAIVNKQRAKIVAVQIG